MPEVLPGCVQPGVGGTGWVRASNHPAPWSLDQPHKMPVCPGRQASFRFATHIGGSQFNGTDNRLVDQTRRWWGGRALNPHLHSLAQPRACKCRSFPDELPSHIRLRRAGHAFFPSSAFAVAAAWAHQPRINCFSGSFSRAISSRMASFSLAVIFSLPFPLSLPALSVL